MISSPSTEAGRDTVAYPAGTSDLVVTSASLESSIAGSPANEHHPSALMAALTAIDDAVPADAPYNQQLIAAKCRGMVMGYDARWSNVQFEVLPGSVEQFIQSDLINIDSSRPSRTFSLAAKKDVTVRYKNQTVLIDHKTTSDDIEDPSSTYWRQLAVEAQPSHYMFIDLLNGVKVDYALWDVVRKPGISPKDITKADHERTATTGIYCGYQLSEETVLELRAGSKRENLEMYTARLADDLINQRPTRFFQRRAVPRLDHQIAEHAREVWMLSQDIITARRENRWPRNSKSCMAYHSPCKFLGICSGSDSEDSDRWTKKERIHAELPILATYGRDVLTFSRLGSLQTCKRKHFYEYELGIERLDEEEKEALYFGTIWHLALEAWFNWFTQHPNQGDFHGNSADLAPANAVGAIGIASEAFHAS
jgi:hypothetical protein